MISIRIRITMKNALSKPSKVIFSFQKDTSTWSPAVKKMFKMPVKIRINTSGFIPRTIFFGGIWETATQRIRNTAITA